MSSSRMNSRQCWTDHQQPKGALLSLSLCRPYRCTRSAARARNCACGLPSPFPSPLSFQSWKVNSHIPNAAHCRRFHATLAFGVGAPCILRYILHGGSRVERGPRADGRTDGRTGRRDRHSKLVSSSGEPLPALHLELTCESFANPLKKPFEKPSKSFLFPSARGAPRCRCPSLAVGRPRPSALGAGTGPTRNL